MSKHWKEPYSVEAAATIGLCGFEGRLLIGDSDSPWLYYVRVCGFTFGFFSLDMLRTYIDYYSRKVLPSTRFRDSSPFSDGPAPSIGDGQSPFERLPGHLRRTGKRERVLKALQKALNDFEGNQKPR